jgi:hypothetical protein
MPTRRTILKKAVYVAPAVMTMSAPPSFASAGSGEPKPPKKDKPKKKP